MSPVSVKQRLRGRLIVPVRSSMGRSYGKVRRRRRSRKPLRKRSTAVRNLKTGTSKSGAHAHVVRKAFPGVVPTTTNTGASFSAGNIQNSVLRTTPDGTGSFGWKFTLQDFPSYTSFTGIYQFYKILYVKIMFVPEQNSWLSGRTDATTVAYTTTALKTTSPFMVVAPDPMSDAVFSTITDALEHDGSSTHAFNNGDEWVVYLEPTIIHVEGETGSTYNVPGKKTWLPTSNTTAPHYGLRAYLDKIDQYTSFRTVMEMKVAFKGLKT